jgi:hypothetical protein
MKISGDRELNLSLYRHWTLFKSLRHTAYTAMKFRTFSLKGEDKLNEFLADLGIPLNQATIWNLNQATKDVFTLVSQATIMNRRLFIIIICTVTL